MTTLAWRERAPHGGAVWAEPRTRARAERRGVTARTLLCAGIVLASFGSVVWRQTVAVERLGELRSLDVEMALARGDAADLRARIEALESRARIVAVAGARLGLRVPADSDVVLLELAWTGGARPQ